MALPVVELRQRVAAVITSELGGGGWRESPTPYDRFPGSDGEGLSHKGFAVGVLRTAVVPREQRQRLGEGVLVESQVSVRWGWVVAALDQVTAQDEALAGEAQLVKAVMSVSRSEGLHLVLQDMSRSIDDQGLLVGTVNFRALHQLALA